MTRLNFINVVSVCSCFCSFLFLSALCNKAQWSSARKELFFWLPVSVVFRVISVLFPYDILGRRVYGIGPHFIFVCPCFCLLCVIKPSGPLLGKSYSLCFPFMLCYTRYRCLLGRSVCGIRLDWIDF